MKKFPLLIMIFILSIPLIQAANGNVLHIKGNGRAVVERQKDFPYDPSSCPFEIEWEAKLENWNGDGLIYIMHVSVDGKTVAFEYGKGWDGTKVYSVVDSYSSPHDIDVTKWHKYMIKIYKNKIEFYIDEEKVDEYTTTVTEVDGYVSAGAYEGSNSFDLYIDNIEEKGCSIRMTEDFEDGSDNYFVDNSGNPIHDPEDQIEIKSTGSTIAAPIPGISIVISVLLLLFLRGKR